MHLSFQEATEYLVSKEVSHEQSWEVVKQLLEDVSFGIGSFSEEYVNELIGSNLGE